MHRLLFRTALVGAVVLSLAACGTTASTDPTSSTVAVAGTNIALADVAQAVEKQCALKPATDTLVNGIAAVAVVKPEVTLGIMSAQAIAGLACSYLTAVEAQKKAAAAASTTTTPAASTVQPQSAPSSPAPAAVGPTTGS